MRVYSINGGERYVLFDDEMKLIRNASDFLRLLSVKGLAKNTIRAYAADLKKYYEFLYLKHYQEDSLSMTMLAEYVEFLKTESEDVASLYVPTKRTAATINRMLSTISSFYQYLLQYEIITNKNIFNVVNSHVNGYRGMFYHTRRNPSANRCLFQLKAQSYWPQILTEEQIQKMYFMLSSKRDKLLFRFLLFSGARISEALALTISDIPIPDPVNQIVVLKNIQSKGKKRNIYIPQFLLEEIDDYIMEERIHQHANHDYLFLTRHTYYQNKRVSYSGVYKIFKEAGKKVGIDFRFHDLRHTYITNLVENGIDFSIVKVLAGHKHISTTEQYVTLTDNYITRSLQSYWEKKAYTFEDTGVAYEREVSIS